MAELFTDATRGQESLIPSESIWSRYSAPSRSEAAWPDATVAQRPSICTPPPASSPAPVEETMEADLRYGCDFWGEYAEAPAAEPAEHSASRKPSRPAHDLDAEAQTASVYGIYDEYDYEIYDEDAYWYYSDNQADEIASESSLDPSEKAPRRVAELHSPAGERNTLKQWWDSCKELNQMVVARISAAISRHKPAEPIYDPYDELADWTSEYDLYPDYPSSRSSCLQAISRLRTIVLLRESALTQWEMLRTASWLGDPQRTVNQARTEIEIALCGTPAYKYWFDLQMACADYERRQQQYLAWREKWHQAMLLQVADWTANTGEYLLNVADSCAEAADRSRGALAERHRRSGLK